MHVMLAALHCIMIPRRDAREARPALRTLRSRWCFFLFLVVHRKLRLQAGWGCVDD